MENHIHNADGAIASGAWAELEQKIVFLSAKEAIDAITIFLHSNYVYSKEVLQFLDTYDHSNLLYTELRDNELAVHVLKEALIKRYRALHKTDNLPLPLSHLAGEIKNCYYFSPTHVKELIKVLPN